MKFLKLNTTEIVEIAKEMFAETKGLSRWLQVYRPYICPFDKLIIYVPPDSRVLDIGCGCGLFLGLLEKTIGLKSGIGFDTSAKAIAIASTIAPRCNMGNGQKLTFTRCRAEEPWPEGLFDVVSMIDVIHHVPPEVQASVLHTAAARVLPGGRFIFKDMCRRPLWRASMNRMHDLIMARQWIHYVNMSDVESWMKECGLQLLHSESINLLWYGHELRVFVKSL